VEQERAGRLRVSQNILLTWHLSLQYYAFSGKIAWCAITYMYAVYTATNENTVLTNSST